VWEEAVDKVSYKSKPVRVQSLINIKISKAYRKVSNDALCILTDLTHNATKIEEAFQIYQLTKVRTKDEALVDLKVGVRYWHHPA
jgi:hypothetical protein